MFPYMYAWVKNTVPTYPTYCTIAPIPCSPLFIFQHFQVQKKLARCYLISQNGGLGDERLLSVATLVALSNGAGAGLVTAEQGSE
jgi:hypothetical protein